MLTIPGTRNSLRPCLSEEVHSLSEFKRSLFSAIPRRDGPVNGLVNVIPDLIRDPEVLEFPDER